MNKQSQNTKQVGVLRNIWDEEFWRGASEKFPKTGKLFALTVRRGEMNQNGEISLSDGDRRQVCRIVRCDGFSLSLKLFTAIKKVCVIFFCGFINSFHLNLFLYKSNILSLSILSLFLVVSQTKCKFGNNKRIWPRWNFSRNNTLLSTITLYSEIGTTCSVNTLSVGRQVRKFPSDKYFWIGKLLRKNILRME